MENVTRCRIVIFDDFKNVLIAERGKGKDSVKTWGIFGKELKGRETPEKCITKAIDKEIKCTIFDLGNFKQFEIENECVQVFTGTIKEYITTNKTINEVKWISKKELGNYNFNEEDKMILEEYFNR